MKVSAVLSDMYSLLRNRRFSSIGIDDNRLFQRTFSYFSKGRFSPPRLQGRVMRLGQILDIGDPVSSVPKALFDGIRYQTNMCYRHASEHVPSSLNQARSFQVHQCVLDSSCFKTGFSGKILVRLGQPPIPCPLYTEARLPALVGTTPIQDLGKHELLS